MPESLRQKFPNSSVYEYDIKKAYKECLNKGARPIESIDMSINFYTELVFNNSEDIFDARLLAAELEDAIEYQVKQYSYCICKSSDSYLKWLKEEFKRKLSINLTKEFNRVES
jgi:hypothetical protein